MKRHPALLSLLLAFVLLVGCGILSGKPVTLREFLSNDQFDAFAAGIDSGEDLPSQLFFYGANGTTDTIDDQTFVIQAWDRLCNMEISPREAQDATGKAGDLLFSFMWEDGRSYTFSFLTSDFFLDPYDVPHEITNPEHMAMLLTSLINYRDHQIEMAEAQAAKGKQITLVDGNIFSWDVDGDGTDETFSVTYHDNGDEAPNQIEIQGVSSWYGSTWIDAAYSITDMYARSDDQGPYLYVDYTWGDYWGHDNPGFCEIRLQDGVLVTIY